jgi:hypothetical protein
MEAEQYFLTSLTAGDISQAAESTKSLSLRDVLDQLCICARLGLELARDAGSAEASRFANIIYERAQTMARGLGFRLALAPSMDGTFIAVELQNEPEDEWRRR